MGGYLKSLSGPVALASSTDPHVGREATGPAVTGG